MIVIASNSQYSRKTDGKAISGPDEGCSALNGTVIAFDGLMEMEKQVGKPILSNMRSESVESTFYYHPTRLEVERGPGVRDYLRARRGHLLAKRLMDLCISLFVIFMIYPWLFPLLALLIKINSRGPVFFRQKRVGYLGETFTCYKFRTMYVNDAADTRQASNNDPRVTRTGWFLRNTCLDELPQFLNVLLGHMSVVGPRPHMLKDSQEFSAAVANYTFRNLVRPGITGISQVRGYRGPVSSFHSIFRRYQWDAYYVRNASIFLDCKIMAETGMLMFRSLINKSKPVPADRPVYEHGGSIRVTKKIA